MADETEQDVAEKLKSSCTSEVYDTLLKIRNIYIQNRNKTEKLQNYFTIKLIIPLMENPMLCNISLSIIADGCRELSFVKELIKWEGPKALIKLMNSDVNDDIQNRVCRALGNVAKFKIGFKAVHLIEPLSSIIKFLSKTTQVNCQQTAIRTLMILAKSPKAKQQIDKENGLIYVAKLLHSSYVPVLICSIKAVASLTSNCSTSSASQLMESDYLKVLIELSSHPEKTVKTFALISLKNLSSHEKVRYDLVRFGAVNIFTEALSSSKSLEMNRCAALTLCRLIDYFHIWSHYGTDKSVGVKALLKILQNRNLKNIHNFVLASLIPLAFENSDILLNLNILDILIEILDNFVKKYECKAMRKFIDSRISCTDIYTLDDDFHTIQDEKRQLVNSKKLPDIDLVKENKVNTSEYLFKTPVSPEKSDVTLYGMNSVTSDYSGSCSPSQTYPASPEFNYDLDVSSPSIGHTSSGICSPASLTDENIPSNANCWSPVVSTHSNSLSQESEYFEFEENEDTMDSDFSFDKEFNTVVSDVKNQENELFFKMSVCMNPSCHKCDSVKEIKDTSKLINKTDFCEESDSISNKKLKMELSIANDQLDFRYKTTEEKNIKEVNASSGLEEENAVNCSCDPSSKVKFSETSSVCSGKNESVKKRPNSTHEVNLAYFLNNPSCHKCDSVNEIKDTSKLINETDSCEESDRISNKKLKTDLSIANDQLDFGYKTTKEKNIKEINASSGLKEENAANCSCDPLSKVKSSETSSVCSGKNESVKKRPNSTHEINIAYFLNKDDLSIPDLKALSKQIDRQTIDRFVLLFILEIYFHIEKKTNCLLAEKPFFSVLINYACLIHEPCEKAKYLLSLLAKNRYCLEKLISNGFFCELEDKMNYYFSLPCNLHNYNYNWYGWSRNKEHINQEIRSDYGVSTLSRILLTSDKMAQFNAICASKLVTDKISLYKILTEANGLPLLLQFLSDADEMIKVKASIALTDIYKSLLAKTQKKGLGIKKEKNMIFEDCINVSSYRCCLGKTCKMEASTRCFYKESCLDVVFVVSGGAKILGNREKICKNSDYFRALLEGYFQEKNKDLVVLSDITAENLCVIFHFLHGCGEKKCCPYITRIPFSVLLELLSDCDRLLLKNIKIFIEDKLYHYIIDSIISSPSYFAKAYKQAKLYNSRPLAAKILSTAMQLDARQRSTWSYFKELLNVGSSINIYEDIESLIKTAFTLI